MSRKLTMDQRHSWVRSTLEHLAALTNFPDAEVRRLIFGTSDLDVRVGFHNINLDSALGSTAQSGTVPKGRPGQGTRIQSSLQDLKSIEPSTQR